MNSQLSERQQRELDYHRERAIRHGEVLTAPFDWNVLRNPGKRWWNAYWQMYARLLDLDLAGRKVLVVGCGFGDDALRLAKAGAIVSAFDLSPESLDIARALAARESLTIDFRQMPAESLDYPDATFDFVVARDILHHVDIALTMREIERVAKPAALVVVNEIYSHSWTDKVRHSRVVDEFAYPQMRRFIYGTERPYITEDERKLTEIDLALIQQSLQAPEFFYHFNFVVTRLVPELDAISKLDQLLLRSLRPLGTLLAGRILFGARVRESPLRAIE